MTPLRSMDLRKTMASLAAAQIDSCEIRRRCAAAIHRAASRICRNRASNCSGKELPGSKNFEVILRPKPGDAGPSTLTGKHDYSPFVKENLQEAEEKGRAVVARARPNPQELRGASR